MRWLLPCERPASNTCCGWPTPVKSCRPRPPGSSPSCVRASWCTPSESGRRGTAGSLGPFWRGGLCGPILGGELRLELRAVTHQHHDETFGGNALGLGLGGGPIHRSNQARKKGVVVRGQAVDIELAGVREHAADVLQVRAEVMGQVVLGTR